MYIYPIDIVFSTVHKSKGLEFDTVVLTDDYLEAERRRLLAQLPGRAHLEHSLELGMLWEFYI